MEVSTRRFAARAPVLLALLLMIAGCAEGRTYPVSVDEARRTLQTTEFPTLLFGAARVESDVVTAGPSDMVWTISQDGDPVLRFRGKLTAKGAAASRIHVQVEGANPRAVQMLKERPAMGRLQVAAMEEQIAADLEKRPFDLTKTYSAMGAALIAERPRMLEEARAMAATAEESDRDNMERAYANEAAGR